MANCGGCGGLQCFCPLQAGNCITITGAGTAISPYVINSEIDPVSGNMLLCGAPGLLVAGGTPVSVGLTGVNSAGAVGTTAARNNHIHAYTPPACRVHNSAAISVANGGVLVLMTFDTELYDTDTMHSTVLNTGRITINTAGVYQVSGCVGFTRGTDYTQSGALIRLNGATYVVQTVVGTETIASDEHFWRALSAPYKFVAGDFIELLAFQRNSAAAARNVLATTATTPFHFGATWIAVG